jgi:hypothetical protein
MYVVVLSDQGSMRTADCKRQEWVVEKAFAVRVLVCGCVACVIDFLPNAMFWFQL